MRGANLASIPIDKVRAPQATWPLDQIQLLLPHLKDLGHAWKEQGAKKAFKGTFKRLNYPHIIS